MFERVPQELNQTRGLGEPAQATGTQGVSDMALVEQRFTGVTAERFADLAAKVKKETGVEIGGNSGSAAKSGYGFRWNYDPAAKGYVPFAQNIMKSGGILTVLLMSFILFRLWRRERIQAALNRGMVTAK